MAVGDDDDDDDDDGTETTGTKRDMVGYSSQLTRAEPEATQVGLGRDGVEHDALVPPYLPTLHCVSFQCR